MDGEGKDVRSGTHSLPKFRKYMNFDNFWKKFNHVAPSKENPNSPPPHGCPENVGLRQLPACPCISQYLGGITEKCLKINVLNYN